MKFEELNGHFKECIRERIGAKIPASASDPTIRDSVVGIVILLADENSFPKAAQRLHDLKQANPATACTYDEALLIVTKIYGQFETEVSILRDLYQMQEAKEAVVDIIGHIEIRLLEP